MRYADMMVAWSVDTKEVMVVPWPDRNGLTSHLRYSVGGAFVVSPAEQVFIDFNTLVVRDGINPINAHNEFLKIDEYRNRVSPEIENPISHPALTRFPGSGEMSQAIEE